MDEKQLHIKLFGKFRLEYNGELITELNSSREQELCAYLLLNSNEPQSRQYISFQFWPDSTEKQARTNLRNLLYKLRKILPDQEQYLLSDNKNLQWNPEASYWIDVEEFEDIVARDSQNADNENISYRISLLTRAVNLYRDDLLTGCYQKWIEPKRKRLQQKYKDILHILIQLLEQNRGYRKAIIYAGKLVECDSVNEAAYRQLMKLYSLKKNRSKALETYQNCVVTLRRELDVGPSRKTKNLYERLKIAKVEDENTKLPYIRGNEEEWSFIGRQEEWESLLINWKQVLSGAARFVMLSGEPGIGKSRLGFEFKQHLEKQGYQTVYTRLYESAENISYGLVSDCLREQSVFHQIKQMNSVWLQELVRVLPELKTDYPDLPEPGPIDEPHKKSQFLATISKVFLNDNKPKLLFLDDLQWCDPESIEWLNCLFHHPKASEILVVGTVRPVEAKRNPPLQTFISTMRQEGRIDAISLDPLENDETKELIASVGGRGVNSKIKNFILSETEGNPLFIVEYVREERFRKMADDRLAASFLNKKNSTLPDRVEAVIASRFQYLSDYAWELMGLAATVGRKFSFEILTAADSADEEKIVNGLDELLRHQIIREHSSAIFDFSHEKLREVSYRQMSETRRRLNNRRIAQAMDQKMSAADDDHYRLGLYYEKAGDLKEAIECYHQAALNARKFFSKQDTKFYKRGLELIEQLPEGEQRDRLQHDLLVGYSLSLGHFKGVDIDEIYEISKRIRALCSKLGKPISASILYTLARGFLFSGKISEAERVGKELHNQAKESGDKHLFVEAYYIRGFIAFMRGNFPKSKKCIQTGLEYYDVQQRAFFLQHSGHDIGMLLNAGTVMISVIQNSDKVSNLLGKIRRMKEESEDPYTIAYMHYLMTTTLHLCNDVPKTRKHAEALISFASDHEYSFWKLTGKILLGWALIQQGNIEKGKVLICEGIKDLRSQNLILKLPYYYALLAEALAMQNKVKKALGYVYKAIDLAQDSGETRLNAEIYRIKGEISLQKDDPDLNEARACLKKSIKIAQKQGASLFEKRAISCLEQLTHS